MPSQKQTILIVDDEPDLLDCYHDVFSTSRIVVHTAENGLRAFELIQNNTYDVIVTDIRMPHVNGLQLITCIKASELNKNCPILVISSVLNERNLPKLERMNMVQTMSKPIEPDDMKQKVEEILSVDRKHAVAYNPKYIELFKSSGHKILQFYFGVSAECQDPYIQRKSEPFGLSTGVVNFFGPEFFGVMSISCDEVFIREFAGSLFEMKPEDVVVDQFKDLVGEIANQIGGAVKAASADLGLDTMLGIPFVMSGEHAIPACVSSPKVALLYTIGNAHCRVEFALGDPQLLLVRDKKDAADIFIYEKKRKEVA